MNNNEIKEIDFGENEHIDHMDINPMKEYKRCIVIPPKHKSPSEVRRRFEIMAKGLGLDINY